MDGNKKTLCAVIMLWVINGFYLTSKIDDFNELFLQTKSLTRADIMGNALGEMRGVVSEWSYLKADQYYNSGVSRMEQIPHLSPFVVKETQIGKYESKTEHNDSSQSGKEENEQLNDDKGKSGCGHEHGLPVQMRELSRFNIIPFIGKEVHITEHRLLRGSEEKEILPWFYYAVKIDPRNVNAYVLGGYWLGARLGEVDEGLNFLREGMRYNPDRWEIYSEMGDLYFYRQQNYSEAIQYYSKAAGLMTDENADRYDRRYVLSSLGASYEHLEQFEKAIEFYRQSAVIFPNHKNLIRKINNLERRRKNKRD